VRADTLPLVLRATGAENLGRGAKVRVRVSKVDLLTLEAHASLVARLDEVIADTAADSAEEDDEEASAASTGLHLAIDLSPESAAADASAVSA